MKLRIALTVLVLILLLCCNVVYNNMQGPIEASIAVNQIEDSNVTYAVSQKVAEGKLPFVWNYGGIILLCFLWGPYLYKQLN